MEILTSEQVDQVEFVKVRNTLIYDATAKLEIGQGLKFAKTEWKAKTPPSISIPSLTQRTKRLIYEDSASYARFKGKKFSVRSTADGKSWVIVRLT